MRNRSGGVRTRGAWRPFEAARTFVRGLGLESVRAWQAWARTAERPADIPTNPERTYRTAWRDWGDWLGTGRVQQRTWRSFTEGRALVRALGLRDKRQWDAWSRSAACPADIPSAPHLVYEEDGWQGLADWLGSTARDDVPEASSTSGQVSRGGYTRGGTVEWDAFFGIHRKPPRDRVWRPFEDARAYVHTLGLRSFTAWRAWSRTPARPHDIPSSPNVTYRRRGWQTWGDWLGTGTVAHPQPSRPFAEARALARSLGLPTYAAWVAWAHTAARPRGIPADPARAYREEGWSGWDDWLDRAPASWRRFAEARTVVQTMGLRNQHEWYAWVKTAEHPADIPHYPQDVYKDQGWVSWGDWLGTGFVAVTRRAWRPFAEARAFARTLGLVDARAWYAWAKTTERPPDIPTAADCVYVHQGWQGWGDWLATGRSALHRKNGHGARSLALAMERRPRERRRTLPTEHGPRRAPMEPRPPFGGSS
jgi:hypothetical protein